MLATLWAIGISMEVVGFGGMLYAMGGVFYSKAWDYVPTEPQARSMVMSFFGGLVLLAIGSMLTTFMISIATQLR
ncbi:hypothetical protein C5B42_04780 [Candidatus Cerribacteria bacterium 'Amazon FNV 2010 28 9']|uniref:Uncharacterized protein n=1 Tax=Candidatus Cerribacteria bacterium 'Amazon FNV 2010 28 9' TaxID=2081795 RepID=A0A317JP75_9BACT|nr:MAG: hypothetical protein C5B42_04780 [Candidatus Cerribacteria bacterium 'Amazon FNV 2010 28 9']